MASYKKPGDANIIKKGQLWKSKQNGRILEIVKKTTGPSGGKHWLMLCNKKTHHVNEGTILKFFERVR